VALRPTDEGTGGGGSPPDDSRREAALQLVLAEYQFVAGLIPFYRGVEMRVLGATGLVLSGVAAAFAALEAAQNPRIPAEATLLALAAWVPAFLLLVEIMALTRLRRASLYIAKRLHPLAKELGGDERLLSWELEPSKELFADTKTRLAEEGQSAGLFALVRERSLRISISSAPLIVAMAAISVLLAVAGWLRGAAIGYLLLGAPAALIAAGLAAYGVAFTALHEGRLLPPLPIPRATDAADDKR
jgi:hypothetical protein